MNYTVLGASGVIGRHVAAQLRQNGHEVFTPRRGDTSIFERPLGRVIYAIGLTADFRTRPFATIEAHITLLSDILQKADFEALVYLSSTRVYSGAASGHEETALWVNPANPSDLYNLSKLMGESLCLNSGRANNIRIARLSNVVGGEDADSDNFIPSLLREAKTGSLVLRSAPESAKDYIHINDVANLLIQLTERGINPIYNLASGIQIRHAEWIEKIQAMTQCSVRYEPDAPLLSFVPIDTTRLQQEFPFAPRSVFTVLEAYNAYTQPS